MKSMFKNNRKTNQRLWQHTFSDCVPMASSPQGHLNQQGCPEKLSWGVHTKKVGEKEERKFASSRGHGMGEIRKMQTAHMDIRLRCTPQISTVVAPIESWCQECKLRCTYLPEACMAKLYSSKEVCGTWFSDKSKWSILTGKTFTLYESMKVFPATVLGAHAPKQRQFNRQWMA